MRPPHRFAIQGDHLALGHGHHGLHPTQKTRAERFRIQAREDIAKRIMRGNPIRQGQEPPKPFLFGFAKGFHLYPTVGTTKDRRKGHDDDVQQQMLLGVIRAWVSQLGKVRLDGSDTGSGHGSSPSWRR